MSSRAAIAFITGVSIALAVSPAHAFETYAFNVPCRATATNSAGQVRPCITCHNNADGGAGCPERPCLNPFGTAFRANGTRWTTALALMDSDGDGYTNGEELGDPMGTWALGTATPGICNCATRPGFPAFTPGDRDGDTDGYCCRGSDANDNGNCLDSGEHDGSADCNDMSSTQSPAVAEMCGNSLDNDCDGFTPLFDPDCEDYVDRDGDDFCPLGHDTNADSNCLGSGEMTTATQDCDDTQATVYPGAFENCIDGRDNDCNGQIDTADSVCRPDRDADGDGFCPIGADLNGDGDCLDTDPVDEANAGYDCDDRNGAVNPDESEGAACTDGLDNDCSGFADFRDPACRSYVDGDDDGYCPGGRDGNGDGDCADLDETNDPGDCDDDDPDVSPGMTEICTNQIDNDCDNIVSLSDPDCAGYLDTDRDRYCFVGFDLNEDRDCADSGEAAGLGDCDDASAIINPDATEVCTNSTDDDCDGSSDAFDQPTCDDYRDRDRDGYCNVGRDLNADRDCADASEQQDPNDAGHDHQPTVYPGAPENCFDARDNDLDGQVDEAVACTRDVDADMDGYCPIGRDLNEDRDCLDAGENAAITDCNDGDPGVHPFADEVCRDFVDLNCDGAVGLIDPNCFFLLDRDIDGFCGMGIDDNGNGNCLDEGEDRFGVDCDDENAGVHPRAAENCGNEIDDECDGLIDAADPSCPCTSNAQCDDGNTCTREVCSQGDCIYQPEPGCGDAGPDAGMEMPPGDCNCRALGSGSAPPPTLLLMLGVMLLAVRRRRR